MKPSGIAFFDLDGTITAKDSFLAFIQYAKGKPTFYLGLCFLSPFIVAFMLGLYPNHKLKERVFSCFFKGDSAADIYAKGAEFSLKVLPTLCYPRALQHIHFHQSMQHRIILLTASSPIWLTAWCTSNAVELIGTHFEVEHGVFTGKISGKNCFGPEKKKIVESILAETPYTETYGYGDDSSDLLFLNLLMYPHFGSLR